MRVLWLSNRVQSAAAITGSGTWLFALADRLTSEQGIELGNVAWSQDRTPRRCDYNHLSQWAVPSDWSRYRPSRRSRLNALLVDSVRDAVACFRPDVIHVWGAETVWGLLTARRIVTGPVLLEMQGLKSAIARCFMGGLGAVDQMRAISLKDLLFRTTLSTQQRQFLHWGSVEQEIVRGHEHISVPSPWMRAQVAAMGVRAAFYQCDLPLRRSFHSAAQWAPPTSPVLFASAAYPAPFKGLHIALRALARLRRRVPNARLRIAGVHRGSGLLRDGYSAWLEAEVRRLGLGNAVAWLGPLSDTEIARELLACSVFVSPSFVESYGLSVAEAMALGVPVVATMTGGAAHLGTDESTTLFALPGDDSHLAWQLERVLSEPGLARRLSVAGRAAALRRHDPTSIVAHLLGIYRAVIGAYSGDAAMNMAR